MFFYLARLFLFVLLCIPLFVTPSDASVRKPGDPTPQEIARQQGGKVYVPANPILASGQTYSFFPESFRAWAKINKNAVDVVLTGVIALFTGLLFVSTFLLWCSHRALANLTHKAFIASHRPRVIVRFVQGPFHDGESEKLKAWITVANIGESDAIIFAAGHDLAHRRIGGQWEDSRDAGAKDIPEITLKTGQRHTFPVEITMAAYPHLGEVMGDLELCAVGEIRYRDRNGIERETGYLRVWNSERGIFVAREDEASEYVD